MIKKVGLIWILIIILVILNLDLVNATAGRVEKCFDCHQEETAEWRNGPHANALADLKNHKQRQEECLVCHSTDYQLGKERDEFDFKEEEQAINCLSCHNDDPQVSKSSKEHADDYKILRRPQKELCADCHSMDKEKDKMLSDIDCSQHNVYYGFGGKQVSNRPDEMVKADVTCIDCHMIPKQEGGKRTHNFRSVLPGEGSPNSCINSGCHENFSNIMLSGVVKRRQQEIKDKLAEVESMLKAKEEYKETKAYKIAKTNYEIVKEDKSNGIHNIYYTRSLLRIARAQLNNFTGK